MIDEEDLITDRDIQFIAIHCSATPEGRDVKMEDVRDWHINNKGWSDIGYHFVIELDGTIKIGRPLYRIGAHVKGYNKNSIGVCYIGGCDENMQPKDTKTDKQNKSLAALIVNLMDCYPKAIIKGHRDFPNVKKACPSFDVAEFIDDLPRYLF